MTDLPVGAEARAPGPKARAAPGHAPSRGFLSPLERHSEILFGLIMAVSIVGSMSVAGAGRDDVRGMLIGALGCNTAWGIVDALMYLMATLVERRRGRALLVALRAERDADRGQRIIADELPPLVAASLRAADLEHVRRELVALETLPRAGLHWRDLAGALGVFLLVFFSTLPVVVPFLLPITPRQALRLSHAVALVLLFVVGYRLGRYVSGRPVLLGASMMAVGLALVGIVMALGG
jgi:VIT1/CCC1 family predicted Fe2+/Mn2+ transporter